MFYKVKNIINDKYFVEDYKNYNFDNSENQKQYWNNYVDPQIICLRDYCYITAFFREISWRQKAIEE